MDERVMKMKVAEALNMMKKGKQEELAKILNKTDKKEMIEKLRSFDTKALKDLNINVEDLKNSITEEDINKIKDATDEDGKRIIDEIKKMLD